MIYPPLSEPQSVWFPIDKTSINTSVRLKPEVGHCLPEALDSLPEDIRRSIFSVATGAKPAMHPQSEDRPPKYNPTIPTRRISIGGFQGIELSASSPLDLGWTINKIAFNPGRVFNGHNGHILNEEQFLHACSTLTDLVRPLLLDPNDVIHLIPGMHANSRAHWYSLEIPFHCLDPDGKILKAFRNAKHSKINLGPATYHQNESLRFDNSQGTLKIRVYRKDLEMKKRVKCKKELTEPVLRIEIALKGNMLKDYLPNAQWSRGDPHKRLTGFRAGDLRGAHQTVMSRLGGFYSSHSSVDDPQNSKQGRYIGIVSHRTNIPVDELIDLYSERFLNGRTIAARRNLVANYRRAARSELERLSTLKETDFTSDGAWQFQPGVTRGDLETVTQARHRDVRIYPEIRAIYGTTH